MYNNALLITLDATGQLLETALPHEEANWRFDCQLAKGEPASLILLDVDADIDFVRAVSPGLTRRISRARDRVSEQGAILAAARQLQIPRDCVAPLWAAFNSIKTEARHAL